MIRTANIENEENISSISEYMRSPISTIKDLHNCYCFLTKFLQEINKDEFYSKGFLQIEGSVEKFIKCAKNNGFENEKECSNVISIAKNLAFNIMRYHNTNENFFQITLNIFRKNNQRKILKYTCEELFLTLFNKINSIYNKIITENDKKYNFGDIFEFYSPNNIERESSYNLLTKSISLINDAEKLNKNEKFKIISKIQIIKNETHNENPDLSVAFGVSKELIIILSALSAAIKKEANIVEAKENLEEFVSIIEKSCINSKLLKVHN